MGIFTVERVVYLLVRFGPCSWSAFEPALLKGKLQVSQGISRNNQRESLPPLFGWRGSVSKRRILRKWVVSVRGELDCRQLKIYPYPRCSNHFPSGTAAIRWFIAGPFASKLTRDKWSRCSPGYLMQIWKFPKPCLPWNCLEAFGRIPPTVRKLHPPSFRMHCNPIRFK